jgi:integrase
VSSAAITQYVKTISQSNKKTGYQYLSRLKQFENFCSQTYQFSIDELTLNKMFQVNVYDLLSGYVSHLVNKVSNSRTNGNGHKVSNLTIKQHLITAKNFLEFYDIEISPRRFKLKVKVPKVIRRNKEPLTKEIIVKILETCTSPKLKSYAMFLAATGCRAREGCSVRLMDLELDKCKVKVRGEYTKTKTDRYVFLTDELVEQLKLWLDYKYRTRRRYLHNSHKNYIFTPERKDTDLVFASSFDGDANNAKEEDVDHLYVTLLLMFQKTMDQLKIGYEDTTKRRRRITLHSFRRYAKSVISDLGYSDYSEWFIGHAGSTYYRKSEKEKFQLFKEKIEPYLVFLDQTGLETRSADLQSRLEAMEKENIELKGRFDKVDGVLNELAEMRKSLGLK